MKFSSLTHSGQNYAAVIDGETAIPLIGITELGRETPSRVLHRILHAGREADDVLDFDAAFPVSEATFRAVVPNPTKVLCAGLNYSEHVAEMSEVGVDRKSEEFPTLFSKFAQTVTGAFDAVTLPPETDFLDYEGELVAVIGAPARRVSKSEALNYVAGFATGNDISMRDYQSRTSQFLAGKAWDQSAPVGPYLVTPDEVGDVQSLDLTTTVNGEVRQSINTSQMIFDVASLIASISEFTELLPGDLIFTGTCSGVGFGRNPPLKLAVGDEVVVEIEKLGATRTKIVAE